MTDEIFAVGSSHPKINVKYMLGLSTLPYIGWAVGTTIGAVAGSILPEYITDALGIALYAMFIAVFIPTSIKNLGVAIAVLLSAGISSMLYFIPVINTIPQGFKIIISALITAIVVAILFPIRGKENAT